MLSITGDTWDISNFLGEALGLQKQFVRVIGSRQNVKTTDNKLMELKLEGGSKYSIKFAGYLRADFDNLCLKNNTNDLISKEASFNGET